MRVTTIDGKQIEVRTHDDIEKMCEHDRLSPVLTPDDRGLVHECMDCGHRMIFDKDGRLV